MYIALEGTNELLKEKLFAQCLEFYKIEINLLMSFIQ